MSNIITKKNWELKIRNYPHIKILGSNIFKLRKKNNLSQRAMAEMLGVSVCSPSKTEEAYCPKDLA